MAAAGANDCTDEKMNELEALYLSKEGKVSDKWELYLREYEQILSPFRAKPIALLEIGVQNGGSLEAFAQYFPVAEALLGCDVDARCAALRFSDSRISVVIGDAAGAEVAEKIASLTNKLHIVIDDGSHCSGDVIRAFCRYFPMLSLDGVYIVEDLHCSYWQEYEGGLFHPYSSLAFFKALVDVVNFSHWGFSATPSKVIADILDRYGCELPRNAERNIHSIEFVNSLCVIRKRQEEENSLGRQVVGGRVEEVEVGRLNLNGKSLSVPDQTNSPWLRSWRDQKYELELRVGELQKEISVRDRVISEVLSSTSWRITRALRGAGRIRNRFLGYFRIGGAIIRAVGARNVANRVWKVFLSEGVSGIVRRGRNVTLNHKAMEAAVGSVSGMEEEGLCPEILHGPRITVIISVYKTPVEMLEEAIKSVLAQVYQNWELILVDDCSGSEEIDLVLRRYSSQDPRIKHISRATNGNISDANNTGLAHATGKYYTILDHDDLLADRALYYIAKAVKEYDDPDYIYSDENKISRDGNCMFGPFYKPDWSPEYMLAMMYTCHMSVFRTELVRSLGGYRSAFDGAQDYELALRVTRTTNKVCHIPKVLYHWRVWENSTARSNDAKPAALVNAKRALQEHLTKSGESFSVSEGPKEGHFRVDFMPQGRPLVSIVIPTANGNISVDGRVERHLNSVCESIREMTDYENYELVVVHNGDLDAGQVSWIGSLGNARLVHYRADSFNLSDKINEGVRAAKGEYLVLMNDDIRVISRNWLSLMLGMVQRKGVGVVGPKLLFPDGTIQHAGVVLLGGLPGHAYYGDSGDAEGYALGAKVNRNYLAVTGACCITPRALFERLGGYRSKYRLNYNDIDYCLRARELGFRSVYLANARLYHYEGVSKAGGRSVSDEEMTEFLKDWGKIYAIDPYYNPSLNQLRPYH